MQQVGKPIIAILCRKDEKLTSVKSYAIYGMAQHWMEQGLEVKWLFGPTAKPVKADVLFMHVNLTVVPEQYIKYAEQYPLVINGRVTDIRKSTVCDHLIAQNDNYTGPVIVKTDLNAAGRPEERSRSKLRRHVQSWIKSISASSLEINSQNEYRIYQTAKDVPLKVFNDPRYVVQKMMAEQEGNTYFVRNYSFLGDHHTCTRLSSKEPIIHLRSTESVEPIDADPRIIQIRHELGFDYGKLDYVVHNDQVVLLDANKTLGVRDRNETDATVLGQRQERANGIFSYLGMGVPE